MSGGDGVNVSKGDTGVVFPAELAGDFASDNASKNSGHGLLLG